MAINWKNEADNITDTALLFEGSEDIWDINELDDSSSQPIVGGTSPFSGLKLVEGSDTDLIKSYLSKCSEILFPKKQFYFDIVTQNNVAIYTPNPNQKDGRTMVGQRNYIGIIPRTRPPMSTLEAALLKYFVTKITDTAKYDAQMRAITPHILTYTGVTKSSAITFFDTFSRAMVGMDHLDFLINYSKNKVNEGKKTDEEGFNHMNPLYWLLHHFSEQSYAATNPPDPKLIGEVKRTQQMLGKTITFNPEDPQLDSVLYDFFFYPAHNAALNFTSEYLGYKHFDKSISDTITMIYFVNAQNKYIKSYELVTAPIDPISAKIISITPKFKEQWKNAILSEDKVKKEGD